MCAGSRPAGMRDGAAASPIEPRWCAIVTATAAQSMPGACELEPRACELERGACELRREACELKRGACELRRGAFELRRGTCELERGACELKPEACELERGACELERGACELRRGACELERGACDSSSRPCESKPGTCESRPAACRFQSGYARGVLDCWRETGGHGRNPFVAASSGRVDQPRMATSRRQDPAQHRRTSVRRLGSLQRRPSPPTRSRTTGANCRGGWQRDAGGTAPARGAVTRLPWSKRAACRRRASSRVAGRGRCGWRCPRRASCRGCGRTCCS